MQTPLEQWKSFADQYPKSVKVKELSFKSSYSEHQLVFFKVVDESLFAYNRAPFNFRGGFFDAETGQVAFSPLLKMFNVGEKVKDVENGRVCVPKLETLESAIDNIEDDDVYLSFKLNGAFGGMSAFYCKPNADGKYDKNSLKDILFCSKSCVHGNQNNGWYKHAEMVRYCFIKQFVEVNEKDLDEKTNELITFLNSGPKYSLIFELLDDVNDPHVSWSGFDEPTVVVIACREMSYPYKLMPLPDLNELTNKFGLKMTRYEKINKSYLNEKLNGIIKTGIVMGEHSEGVIVYANDSSFFFKWKVMKLNPNSKISEIKNHYGFRRHIREILRSLLAGSEAFGNKVCPLMNKFTREIILFFYSEQQKGNSLVLKGFGKCSSNLPLLDYFFEWLENKIISLFGREFYLNATVETFLNTELPEKHVFVMIGAQGSSKSTLARAIADTLKEFRIEHVISDKVPNKNFYIKNPFESKVISHLNESETEIVICDKMNINSRARKLLFNHLSYFEHAKVHIIDCSTKDSNVLIRRVENRGNFNSTMTPQTVSHYDQVIKSSVKANEPFNKKEFKAFSVSIVPPEIELGKRFDAIFDNLKEKSKIYYNFITKSETKWSKYFEKINLYNFPAKVISIDYAVSFQEVLTKESGIQYYKYYGIILQHEFLVKKFLFESLPTPALSILQQFDQKGLLTPREDSTKLKCYHITLSHSNNCDSAYLMLSDLFHEFSKFEVLFNIKAIYYDNYSVALHVKLVDLHLQDSSSSQVFFDKHSINDKYELLTIIDKECPYMHVSLAVDPQFSPVYCRDLLYYLLNPKDEANFIDVFKVPAADCCYTPSMQNATYLPLENEISMTGTFQGVGINK
ncbi:hypothetical protein ROZALSC1DRAFT_20523 [Rozella allomycis CSF55]|uniref:Uncharacterized protein n=1 Tax=Rozella allomycis (strain CSF55) TaxID=988480 RepID=A0A4P9YRU9_ROZAC|nr:hypothetical protein ROZALSC1DRAFT_20523 [Rozella allomycis CSF55]